MKNSIIALHGTDQETTVEDIHLKLVHPQFFYFRIMVAPQNGNFVTSVNKLPDDGRADKTSASYDQRLHDPT